MNKLSKDKRDKLILVMMGAAVVVTVLYLFFISPARKSLAEYADKTRTAKGKLAKAEVWMRMAPEVRATAEATRKELEGQHEAMAPVDKFAWFYKTLEGFSGQYRVKLIDITREPQIGEVELLPKFPYRAATFGVKITARYHELGRFVADFENRFPYLRIQNLTMEPEVSAGSTTSDGAVAASSENLLITMRVVTLIKPTSSI